MKKDLIFTGALAQPSMAARINEYLIGPLRSGMVDYEFESGQSVLRTKMKIFVESRTGSSSQVSISQMSIIALSRHPLILDLVTSLLEPPAL